MISQEKLDAVRRATARRAAACILQGMAVREAEFEFMADRVGAHDVRAWLIALADGETKDGLRHLSDMALALDLRLQFSVIPYDGEPFEVQDLKNAEKS
jgi:hypothetical protein